MIPHMYATAGIAATKLITNIVFKDHFVSRLVHTTLSQGLLLSGTYFSLIQYPKSKYEIVVSSLIYLAIRCLFSINDITGLLNVSCYINKQTKSGTIERTLLSPVAVGIDILFAILEIGLTATSDLISTGLYSITSLLLL